MAVEDVVIGAGVLREENVEVTMSRIGGGEALLHPRFEEIAKAVLEHWSRNGEVKTTVATNGVVPRVKGLGLKYNCSPPSDKIKHRPCMVSPHDVGVEPEHGFDDVCRAAKVCGRLFDAFGFSSCPYAGIMGRVLDIDPYSAKPVEFGHYDICRHCIHSLGSRKKNELWTAAENGEIDFPTVTFREGMKRGLLSIKRFQQRLNN